MCSNRINLQLIKAHGTQSSIQNFWVFFHEIGTYLTRIIELLSKKRYNRLNNAAKLEIIFQRYSLR